MRKLREEEILWAAVLDFPSILVRGMVERCLMWTG